MANDRKGALTEQLAEAVELGRGCEMSPFTQTLYDLVVKVEHERRTHPLDWRKKYLAERETVGRLRNLMRQVATDYANGVFGTTSHDSLTALTAEAGRE
jgi:hypothetical protein